MFLRFGLSSPVAIFGGAANGTPGRLAPLRRQIFDPPPGCRKVHPGRRPPAGRPAAQRYRNPIFACSHARKRAKGGLIAAAPTTTPCPAAAAGGGTADARRLP